MDVPRQKIFNVPPVVLAAIVLMGLIHAVRVLALTRQQANDVLLALAFIPARYDLSVLHDESWVMGWGAGVWTFVTYAFLHVNINHLVLNLVWLLVFGTPLARRFGALRFIGFSVVTAIAGAAVHLATHWHELLPMIGASAAISGAMAGAMRFAFQGGGPAGLLRSDDPDAYRVPALPLRAILREPRVLVFLIAWLVLNLLFGLGTFAMPGAPESIAWEAHIGGFAAGLIAFTLFDPVDASVESAAANPDSPDSDSADSGAAGSGTPNSDSDTNQP